MTQAVSIPSASSLDNARCLGCDYPLRGLVDNRCPECGRQFDPTDPWTMNISRPHGNIISALLTPIGWPTVLAAVVATIAIFCWTAGLPCAPFAMVFGLLTWFIIYVYRIARFTARRLAASIYRQPLRPRRRVVFPVLIILSGLMIWTRLPLRTLFWLSRPALDRIATHYYEEVPLLSPPPPPRFVGLFPVSGIDVTIAGVTINIDARTQLFYSPEAERPYQEYRRFIHLGGKWYVSQDGDSDILVRPVDYVRYKLFKYPILWR